MARCRATTRKRTRCRNEALEGSGFCGVHAGAEETREARSAGGEARARAQAGAQNPTGERDGPAIASVEDAFHAAVGVAVVGGMFWLALKLARRW